MRLFAPKHAVENLSSSSQHGVWRIIHGSHSDGSMTLSPHSGEPARVLAVEALVKPGVPVDRLAARRGNRRDVGQMARG